MSGEALKMISEAMRTIGLKYGFMEYVVGAGDVLPKTYFVGEYQELETEDESGEEDNIFILTGFSREDWGRLEQAKEEIKRYFPCSRGRTEKTESGAVETVFMKTVFRSGWKMRS